MYPGGVMLEGRMSPLEWDPPTEPIEDAIGILAPRDGDGRRGDGIFEDQIPADDPRDQLAHCRVGVSVGTAGDGNHRREFRVTEARERASNAGDDERQHN